MNGLWGLLFVDEINKEQYRYEDNPETEADGKKKKPSRLRLVISTILNIFRN